MNDNRPGYKTTEFWLTLVCLVFSVILGAGLIEEASQTARLLSAAVSALTVLGYSHSRGTVKSASLGLEAFKLIEKKTEPTSMGN
jgi:hypothetical protein